MGKLWQFMFNSPVENLAYQNPLQYAYTIRLQIGLRSSTGS